MGADTGISAGLQVPARVVHLAAGSYRLEGSSLAGNVSLLGAGAGTTVLSGESLVGLRSEAVLAGLTVTEGSPGGVLVGAGEAPEIQQVEATQNEGVGLRFDVRAGGQVVGSVVSANAGSGLHTSDGDPVLVGCSITDNKSPDYGGGVVAVAASGTGRRPPRRRPEGRGFPAAEGRWSVAHAVPASAAPGASWPHSVAFIEAGEEANGCFGEERAPDASTPWPNESVLRLLRTTGASGTPSSPHTSRPRSRDQAA